MKTKQSSLFLVALYSFFTLVTGIVANATEVTDCTAFNNHVNYDLNNFKYKVTANTRPQWYSYLSDSIYLGVGTSANSVNEAYIDVALLDGGKAVINYMEAEMTLVSPTERVLSKKLFSTKYETTWKIVKGQLYVDNLGVGQAAVCHSVGPVDLYFSYQTDIGPTPIKGRNLVLRSVIGTGDPIKR